LSKSALFKALILSPIFVVGLMLPPIYNAKANFIPPYDHAPKIFITENGQIYPPSTLIERVENTYILTGKIKGGISIEKNNIRINGAGNYLEGDDTGTGIYLKNVTDIVVENIKIQNFGYGIYITQSQKIEIKKNTLNNCIIRMSQSSECKISENKINNGQIYVQVSNKNFIYNNKANKITVIGSSKIEITNNQIIKPIKQDQELNINTGLQDEAGGLSFVRSEDIFVSENMIENQITGISIIQCKNLTLNNNKIRENQFFGIRFRGSDLEYCIHNIDTSNTIDEKPIYFLVNTHDFTVPQDAGWIAAINCSNIKVEYWVSPPNFEGILFVNTINSRITYSNFTKCHDAIRFDNVTNCVITKNYLADNAYAAFYFENTIDCLVKENEVKNNCCFFNIWHDSTNNIFYHNIFIGNWSGSGGDRWSENYFDNGSEGNYWIDYIGSDINGDGIGDTPHIIDENNQDNYPLIAPIAIEKPQAQLYPTSTPSFDLTQFRFSYSIRIIIGSVITLAILGILVYFKRRRT